MSEAGEAVLVTQERHPVSRRRRLAATCVGAVLAAAGGIAGWGWLPPMYRSVGHVEIQPRPPHILFRTETNEPQSLLDAYVQTQMALATSRRVVDMAMASAEWRKLGRPGTDEAIARFGRSLSAARPARTFYVEVSFLDEDPEAATTAVNAVLAAYMTLVRESETTSGMTTVKVLEYKRQALNNQLGDLRMTAQQITEDWGRAGFDARCRSATDRLIALDARLMELDLDAARRPDGVEGEEARLQRARTTALREAAEEEVRRLGKRAGQLAQIDAERENVEALLSEVHRRLDELNVESQRCVSGRVRIASTGDRPVQPEPEPRRRFTAAIGAVAGFLLGFGAVLLTVRRRAA